MGTLVAVLGGLLLVALAFIKILLENQAQQSATLEQKEKELDVTNKITDMLVSEQPNTVDSLRKGDF